MWSRRTTRTYETHGTYMIGRGPRHPSRFLHIAKRQLPIRRSRSVPALTAMSALSLLLCPRDATLRGLTCLRR